MSGVVHHRSADLAARLGIDNPFQPYPSSTRSVVSIRVSKINPASCAVIPCLQDARSLRHSVADLAMPAASRFTPASSPLELRIPAQLTASTGQPKLPRPVPGPL